MWASSKLNASLESNILVSQILKLISIVEFPVSRPFGFPGCHPRPFSKRRSKETMAGILQCNMRILKNYNNGCKSDLFQITKVFYNEVL